MYRFQNLKSPGCVFNLMMPSFADIIELSVVDEWSMSMKYGQADTERGKSKFVYLFSFITAVTIFWKPNAIPL